MEADSTTPRLPDSDFVIAEGGVWLELKKFAIRVKETDEGVVVDIYKSGEELQASLATCFALDSDTEEDEDDEILASVGYVKETVNWKKD